MDGCVDGIRSMVTHGFLPAGYTTLGTSDPNRNVHLIWCDNEAGCEAIGVIYTPAGIRPDELKPALVNSVMAAPVERLFSGEGVLNRGPLQCTGPFPVQIGGMIQKVFVVAWSRPDGPMRAFLVIGALELEHAIEPILRLYEQSKKPKNGIHLIVSDTIQLIQELDDIIGGTLQPQHDFKFRRVMPG